MSGSDTILERATVVVLSLTLVAVAFVFYSGPRSFLIPKSVVMEAGALIAAALLILRPLRRSPAVGILILAFCAIYALSILQAQNPLMCLKTAGLFLGGAALAFAVSSAVSGAARLKLFCLLIAGAGAVLAALELANYLFRFFDVDIGYHVFSPAGMPGTLAGYLAVCVCFAVAFLVGAKSRSGAAAWACVLALLVAGLVVSFSRSGMLAAAAGVAVTILLLSRNGRFGFVFVSRRLAAGAFAVAAIVALASIAGALSESRPGSRSLSPGAVTYQTAGAKQKKESVTQRILILRCGIEVWRRRPFLGNGPGTFEYHYPLAQAELIRRDESFRKNRAALTGRIATHAHNEYLELAAETGLAGLAAFLALAAMSWIAMLRGARAPEVGEGDPAARCAVAGAFAALLLQAAFEFTLHDPLTATLFWALVGLGTTSVSTPREPARERNIPGTLIRAAEIAVVAAALFLIPRPLLAMLNMMEANRLGFEGEFRKSAAYFDRAVALDPTEPLIYINAAAAQRAIGDFGAAAGRLEKALGYSNNPSLYDALGRTYAYAGEPEEAEKVFRTLLSIDPWRLTTMVNLAEIYRKEGRRAEAEELLRRALELDPGYPPAIRSLEIMEKN